MSIESAKNKIYEIRADKSLNEAEKSRLLSELYPVAYQDETPESLGVKFYRSL